MICSCLTLAASLHQNVKFGSCFENLASLWELIPQCAIAYKLCFDHIGYILLGSLSGGQMSNIRFENLKVKQKDIPMFYLFSPYNLGTTSLWTANSALYNIKS